MKKLLCISLLMALIILPTVASAADCIETFNTTVITIEGDYDSATDLCNELSPNYQDCMDLAQLDYDTRLTNAVNDFYSCCCLQITCSC